MSVPGSNLLLEALDVIASQPVQYLRFLSNTTTGAGRNVPSFAPAVPVNIGSVQAVPLNRYQFLGLDLEKDYVTWFVPQNVVGVERDSAGDRIKYAGKLWQLQSTNSWFAQDGWLSIVCVGIGNDA